MEHSRHVKSSKGDEYAQNIVEPESGHVTHKALLNDVVLQNIFKYLNYQDLKSCRELGNTTWLINSKKAWWTQTKVVFKERRGLAGKIKDYLKQTEITSNAINYKIDVYTVGFQGFWERLGPLMKSLEIGFSEFQSVEDFRRFIYTQCPNLEKLVLSRFYHIGENSPCHTKRHFKEQEMEFGKQTNLKFLKIFDYGLPVSWMELLSHFPNLKEFETTRGDPELFKAISMIRQRDPKLLKLTHIKITSLEKGDYSESFRSVLLDQNLSFELIHMNADDCSPLILGDILDLHAHSLKELHIFGRSAHHSEIKLPRKPLQNLEELGIHICLFHVDFLKYTPSLKKATLVYNTIRKNHSSPDPNLRVDTCKELTLYPSIQWENTPNSDFEYLINVFPNVEILETRGINNFRFLKICELMPKLVYFEDGYKSEVDVKGLLGYDPECKHNKPIRNPNITDLKDLKTFSMASYCGSNANTRNGVRMKNGSEILKELNELRQLRKFTLKDYNLQGDDRIWRNIFSKYSG